jgi:NADH dehydrogenase FAD-containing subunit
VARTKWNDLSPRRRRLVVVGGAIEGVLKAAALADLARRPAAEVNGSKTLWAFAITLINAFGAVPIVYFVYGRRPSS